MAKPYILYTHHDSEITSLKEFVENLGLSIVRGMTVQEVLLYQDDQGKTNNDRIYEAYNRYEKREFINEFQSKSLDLLKINTTLALPKDKIFKETLAITGKNQISEQKSFEGFYAQQLFTLLQDNRYKKSYSSQQDLNSFTIEYPNITVWLWCRSLSNENEGELQGQVIDISPFIESVRTTVDSNGGNFNITLVPAQGIWSEDQWKLNTDSISQYFDSFKGASFVSHQSIRDKIDNDAWKRTNQFLNMCVNTNDVVFIRFETLDLEDRNNKDRDFVISKNKLSSSENDLRVYDMIGLIDQSGYSASFNGNDISLSLQGKDLSKLLIDDGSYFYPLQFAQNVFVNPDENDKLIKRLATDGQFILQSSLAYRSIRFTLEYIINHLASIGITPDELWESYGDKRTKVYRLDNDRNRGVNQPNSSKVKELTSLQKEINSLIVEQKKQNQVFADEQREFILTSDVFEGEDRQELLQIEKSLQGNFNTEVKDIVSAFNLIQEWMSTIDTSNSAIEIRGELSDLKQQSLTFNSQNVDNSQSFGNRLTPSQIRLEGVTLSKGETKFDSGQGETTQFTTVLTFNTLAKKAWRYFVLSKSNSNNGVTDRLANGIWQIIKLVVDEDISNRRIADPSVSQPDGSLINQFRKICQEPFVEFFTDTYEDLFYFIVRQPPFTKESIISFLDGVVKTEIKEILLPESFNQIAGSTNATGIELREVEVKQDIVIEINDNDVHEEQLNFSDSDVYSFYELKPQGLFAGKGSEVSLAYIPIVYFPQYADIWGTRRLSIVSNYLPYNGLVGSTQKQNTNWIVEQSAIDLKFLIETNCYLPFTRRGTIVINGDRRIKRGTFIRFKPTGEIYYVDSVSHYFAISESRVERTTTLQVSRGMVEEYIRGKTVLIDGAQQEVSYFNIVDTELIKKFIVSSLSGDTKTETDLGVQLKRSFGVNDKVFNFFLKRRQYS